MTENSGSDRPASPPLDFVVQDIFPTNQIHIIFGPSGVGKTTLMLQMLDDWSNGEDWLEHKSYPAKFCYVACNRDAADLRKHMTRLGLDPAATPHLSMVDAQRREERTFDYALERARKLVPRLAVLFLDGLATLCQGRINDHADVTQFLMTVLHKCQQQHITVIGSLLASKARTGEGYESPRDRLLGAGTWGSSTATKASLDPSRPSAPQDPGRTLILMPQHAPGSLWNMAFDETGRLVNRGALVNQSDLDTWMIQQTPEAMLTSATLLVVAEHFGVAKSTLYRWIENQLELGALKKVGHGQYQVPARPGLPA